MEILRSGEDTQVVERGFALGMRAHNEQLRQDLWLGAWEQA
jgi:hypothetical protein